MSNLNKKTTAPPGLSQNGVLRIYDIVVIAVVLGFTLAFFAYFMNSALFVGLSLLEVSVAILAYIYAYSEKKKIVKLGLWRKLSFRESIDLHEWYETTED
jgi:hypothetical protein